MSASQNESVVKRKSCRASHWTKTEISLSSSPCEEQGVFVWQQIKELLSFLSCSRPYSDPAEEVRSWLEANEASSGGPAETQEALWSGVAAHWTNSPQEAPRHLLPQTGWMCRSLRGPGVSSLVGKRCLAVSVALCVAPSSCRASAGKTQTHAFPTAGGWPGCCYCDPRCRRFGSVSKSPAYFCASRISGFGLSVSCVFYWSVFAKLQPKLF